jgi:hypothetical protein
MARIGTVGIGRIGGLGQDVCPAGFYLDDSGVVCLPYDMGGSVQTPPYIPPPPPESQTALENLLSTLPILPPSGSVPSIKAPLPPVQMVTGYTGGGTCPVGFDLISGVCLPSGSQAPAPVSTTIIPGVSNTVLYAGVGVVLLMMFMQKRR